MLNQLCCTQSKGDHDDKRSYLHKIRTRYFTYFEITQRRIAFSFSTARS